MKELTTTVILSNMQLQQAVCSLVDETGLELIEVMDKVLQLGKTGSLMYCLYPQRGIEEIRFEELCREVMNNSIDVRKGLVSKFGVRSVIDRAYISGRKLVCSISYWV